jgi:hypothetical protein
MLASKCPRLIQIWMSRDRRRSRGVGRRRSPGGDRRADRPVRPLAGRAELREVAAPALRDAIRVAQVLLVEGVEKLGVAAVQWGGFEHGRKTAGRPIV